MTKKLPDKTIEKASQLAEVIKGYNRYRLTQPGMSVTDDINDSFETCLYEWFNKYNVEL
jgi:hypothetical protein